MLLRPSHQLIPISTLMLRPHTMPWVPIVILPLTCMQRYISVAHDKLAKQINTVIIVFLLLSKRIGLMVVVGVVGFFDFVHAVECVNDVECREVAALVVV